MDIADKKLEDLFNTQEQIKQSLQGEQEITNNGLPQAQYGYRLNDSFGQPTKKGFDYGFSDNYNFTNKRSGVMGGLKITLLLVLVLILLLHKLKQMEDKD